jgi:hypothetical protein
MLTSVPVELSLAIISTSSTSRVKPLMEYLDSAVTLSFENIIYWKSVELLH